MAEIIQIIGRVVEYFYLKVQIECVVVGDICMKCPVFFSGFPFLNGQLEQFETVEMTQ